MSDPLMSALSEPAKGDDESPWKTAMELEFEMRREAQKKGEKPLSRAMIDKKLRYLHAEGRLAVETVMKPDRWGRLGPRPAYRLKDVKGGG